MGGASDILEQDEVEHVGGDGDVQLAYDHADDVGDEEDTGQEEDTHEVTELFCSEIFGERLVPHDEIGDAHDDVENRDTDRTDDGGDDDGDGDGSRAKTSPDMIADRARNIHGLAKNLICQDSVDEGDEPDDAEDALAEDGGALEYILLVARTLPR